MILMLCATKMAAQTAPLKSEWASAYDWASEQHPYDEIDASLPGGVLQNGQREIQVFIDESLSPLHARFRLITRPGMSQDDQAKLIYRASWMDSCHQLALLHLVHPDLPPESLKNRMLFRELVLDSSAQFARVVQSCEKDLAELKGPVLPLDLGCDGTTYRLEVRWSTRPTPDHSYSFWGGIDAEDLGIPGKARTYGQPLEWTLYGMEKQLADLWQHQQEEDGFRNLIARLDMPALGAALFQSACDRKWMTCANHLLNAGLDPRKPGPDGAWPLVAACRSGNLDLVKRLLKAGASPNVCNTNWYYLATPLTVAACSGNRDLLDLLGSGGARPKASDAASPDSKESLAMAAIESKSLDILQRVLKLGARFGGTDRGGPTPLTTACSSGNLALAKFVASQEIKPSVLDLCAAAAEGSLDIMTWLMNAGVDSNGCKDRIPLFNAAWGGHIEAVQMLLKRGADVNRRYEIQSPGSPLEAAQQMKHQDVVQVLINAGAKEWDWRVHNWKPSKPHGWETSLTIACRQGNLDQAKAAAARGIQPSAFDLCEASANSSLELMNWLMDSGLSANGMDRIATPLAEAAKNGRTEAVRLLLKRGADVNARLLDQSPCTALEAAQDEKHWEVTDLLLKAGAKEWDWCNQSWKTSILREAIDH